MAGKPRAELDTNVLVSGLISPLPAAILRALRSKRFILVSSPPINEEIMEVLSTRTWPSFLPWNSRRPPSLETIAMTSVTWAFGPPMRMKVPPTCHSERSEESAFLVTAQTDSSSVAAATSSE
jgi:hypothetical protein